MDTRHQQHWQLKAKKLARRLNVGWWLDASALPLLIVALILTAAILFYRQNTTVLLGPLQFALVITPALLIVGFMAWWRAKARFITENDALVRLEIRHGLNNALSAARSGRAPWPDPISNQKNSRWNWPRLVLPPLATCALLVSALYLPLGGRETTAPPAEPAAVTTLEKTIEKLRAQETVDREDLARLEKQVEQLRQNNAKDWFSHASLEASDNLKQAQQSQLRELSRELEKSENSLKSLQNDAAKLQPEQRARQEKNFQDALEKMEQGALKPNKELLEQLKNLDPKEIENLPPEQLEKLRKELQKRAGEAKEGAGENGKNDAWAKDKPGEGEGKGDQPGPGQGAPQRGPGNAPEFLGPKGPKIDDGDLQKVDPEDRRDLSPGDLLETKSGEHKKNEGVNPLQDGGATSQPGEGGSRLWQESLLPEEQKALKGYFK